MVIRRRCHPDYIKQSTSEYFLLNNYEFILEEFRSLNKLTEIRVDCERFLGNELSKSGKDDEYEIHDVFRLMLSKVAPSISNSDKVVDELYSYELQTEIDNDYLDPTIVDTISQYKFENIAYISDFYADTKNIEWDGTIAWMIADGDKNKPNPCDDKCVVTIQNVR